VFPYINQACLTAGTTAQPGSVPPCGGLAPQDPNGSGVLENTDAADYTDSWVLYGTPVSTALGVQVSFTIYSFGGDGADGQLLFFTDASKGPPENIGQNGGELGYTPGSGSIAGLQYAYLGMGFDEYGTFSLNYPSQGLNGGVGQIAQTIAVRGAVSTKYYYLGGALNAQGQPASLPFDWDSSGQNRPSTGPTVFVTLSPTGYLTCAVDIHNGQGFITYYAQSIVGIQGQPAVPPYVYVGVTGSTGGADNRHQISDLYIWQG
jgi:MSHA biogenesis protein MshQ